MAKTLAVKSLADLCVEYNALLVAAGKKPIKKFACSRAEAEAKIAKLQPAKAERKAKANGDASEPRITIKSIAVPLIINGTDKEQVIATVKASFPDCAFDAKHVAWYKSRINSGAIKA